MTSKWIWILMILAANKSATCKVQGFKKSVIHLMQLIFLNQELDLLVKDKNKNYSQLVIIRNSKEFKILN